MIRLLIVDDHPVVRDGLRGMFDQVSGISVVGDAGDGLAALELVAALRPDVVLMDLRMPALDGVEAIVRLRRGHPAVKVLVLTTYETDRDIDRALEAGAAGYLLKDAPRADLHRAVRDTAAGRRVLSPAIAERLADRISAPAAPAPSQRELEVLRLVASGAANKSIARELLISETTVKTHLAHVYAKLGVDNRAAAVAVAIERGLITP